MKNKNNNNSKNRGFFRTLLGFVTIVLLAIIVFVFVAGFNSGDTYKYEDVGATQQYSRVNA